MDIVLRESERLNTTIGSFLAYARPQRFAIARFDVRRALNDTALLLRNSAEVHEGHVIDVDVPPSELWYEADEGQIKQIVWNLATNGLRAMPDGGRLRLIGAFEPASEGVVITVQDEGVGIPPEELDALFQPFHGTFAKGSGLGLAIVHRIVTDYNGEIQVSSQPGPRHHRVGAPAGARRGDDMTHAGSRSRRRTPPAAHPRRRRRAIDARAAGHRAPARRLRSAARRERPASRHRHARARAGGHPDLRHQDARSERRRGAARRQADRQGHPRHHDHRRSRRRKAPSKRCGSAPATT